MVHLISVLGGHSAVLKHFIGHYKNLGIQSFRFIGHTESRLNENQRAIEEIVAAEGLSVDLWAYGPWDEDLNSRLYRSVMERSPNDWFVIADLDEFHVYPDHLSNLVRYAEQHGYDSIQGCFLDRLAESGSLAAVCDEDIFSQFPLAGFLSYPLLGATPNKICLARGKTLLNYGQHSTINSRPCPRSDLYVQVHHFKWTEGLDVRLAYRAEMYRTGKWRCIYDVTAQEALTFVKYYSECGRIDTSNPAFLFYPCLNDYQAYPHWRQVVSMLDNSQRIW